MDLLECVQRKATKVIQRMEHLSCERFFMTSHDSSLMRGSGALQPGEEKAPGRPESDLSVSKRGQLFIRVCCGKTKENGFKLKERDLDWI